MASVLDCNLEISNFKSQLHYYIHFRTNTFGKSMSPFIPSAMG